MTLDQWLTARGVTQQQAADLIGCAQSHIAMLAAGQRAPSLNMLRRINAATDGEVGLDDFTGDRG